MSVPNGLERLAGRWHGTYLLVRPWVTPAEVTGSYPAPPDPDWQWRTRLQRHSDGFEMVMTNIAPGGKEELAVRARYRRES